MSDKAEDRLVADTSEARVSPNCGDIWIDGNLVLGLAGTALAFIAFVLNQAITQAGAAGGGRKRKVITQNKKKISILYLLTT